MVNVLAGFLSHLAAWTEGCVCHETELTSSSSWFIRARETRQDGKSCAYKGRRAAELAAGYLDSHVEWLASSAMADIVAFSQNLSDEEQTRLLTDWNHATDKALFEIQLKTQHWKLLPWSLAVVSHHDIDVARAGLRRCRESFQATDP